MRKQLKRQKTQSELFLQKASEVAYHYGFEHILEKLEEVKDIEKLEEEELLKIKKRKQKINNFLKNPSQFCDSCIDMADIYHSNFLHRLPHPVLVYYSNGDSKINSPFRRKTTKKEAPYFSMQIVGSEKHIGESLLLKTAITILKEMGFDNFSIALNSVGDKNSSNSFEEELSNYIRTNLHVLPTKCRQSFKKDSLETLECIKKYSPVLLSSIPKTMQFLNENSREHLRQVIEHLDMEDISYELDESLTGPKNFYSETIFEIRNTDVDDGEHRVMAFGGRYNNFLQHLFESDIPATGITICTKQKKETLKNAPKISSRKENPGVYLIQIGFDSRVKSFKLLEELRMEGITVIQSIIYEKIDPQIKEVEKTNSGYLIIIGQKEAMEDVVMVRNIETQVQDVIPMHKVVDYLKKKIL